MKKIIAEIDPKTGEVTYHVEGVQGQSCMDITKALVQANEEVSVQQTAEAICPEVLPDYVTNMGG